MQELFALDNMRWNMVAQHVLQFRFIVDDLAQCSDG